MQPHSLDEVIDLTRPRAASGARVLVIDDDRSIRELVAELAADAGHEAVCVATFDEFQRRYSSEFDLVLLDLHMPDVDGVELLRFIASSPEVPRIAVMSGLGYRIMRTVEELVQLQGLQVAGTLAKPFSAKQLLDLFAAGTKPHVPSQVRVRPQVSEKELERAIDARQLTVYYQPKVRLRDRVWVGVEALVRWQLPNGQWLPPDAFIPIAEQSALIGRLTEFVLETSLRDAAKLRADGYPLEFAINVSMHDLEDLTLPARIETMVRSASQNLSELQLEITESGLMRDQVGALDVLSRLCLKGARVSIDDFGTGYASLHRLCHMPFDEMKIDVSFVRRALQDEKSRVIVENSLELAKRLKMRAVAEGIENYELWQWLEGLGCDYAQGYWIGRPMPVADLIPWSKDWAERASKLV